MKKIIITIIAFFICFNMFSQTYKSSYVIRQTPQTQNAQWKDRIITITDKEISITNLIDGGTKTLYLIINKTEEKEWMFDGVCKTYYCTTKDEDFINGYQKAIVYHKKYDKIVLALFANEITVYVSQFDIE